MVASVVVLKQVALTERHLPASSAKAQFSLCSGDLRRG